MDHMAQGYDRRANAPCAVAHDTPALIPELLEAGTRMLIYVGEKSVQASLVHAQICPFPLIRRLIHFSVLDAATSS